MPDRISSQLDSLRRKGLLRSLRPATPLPHGQISIDGNSLTNFASNDYLGLSHHPALAETMIAATRQFGVGSGASRLVTGTWPAHDHLESTVAALKGTPAALSFSSGFAMASSLIPCLVSRDDLVILDKLSHACLIDGAKMSGATLRVFPHNDTRRLEKLLASARQNLPASTRILIATESVFSMDGDRAPLAEIVRLKNQFGAMLLVDEAHSFGVIGPHGAGLARDLAIPSADIDFHMGTFSKAVGLSGGYIACTQTWKDWLVNNARSFIFSTAPPPALAATISRSLEIISSPEGDSLRQRARELGELWLDLQSRIPLLRQLREQASTRATLPPAASQPSPPSTIFPVIVGENHQAMELSAKLRDSGFLAPAIRFPTVPHHTARLRLTITAAHSPDQIHALANALDAISA